MKELISATAAYSAFSGDIAQGRLSHAYMLHFKDGMNMRAVLKIFALRFFGFSEDCADGKRVLNESYSALKIYPEDGKKFTADSASALLADCVLKPVEGDKKLVVVSGFENTAPIIQNKLLKTLEEPCEGVYFLLGTTALAPVLDTVKSRVKTLTVPPFSADDIFSALERKGHNSLNRAAAENCGGILGVAEGMVGGGWFNEVSDAAEVICTTTDIADAGRVAAKYGDTKYKAELLSAIANTFHRALVEKVNGGGEGKVSACWRTPTLIYAGWSIDKAARDLKFNAFFQGLLYDLMLRIIEENDKWSKLQG